MNKPRRWLFLMKITIAQILISSFSIAMVYAIEGKGQEVLDRKISIDVEGAEFQQVLLLISNQAKVKFAYSPELVQGKEKVSLHVKEERLIDVMTGLLGPDISYKVIGKQIVLGPVINQSLSPGNGTVASILVPIAGRVTDAAGNPIPGVNILEKGTTNGTTSDSNGEYILAVVNEDAVLVFSFIGYTTQELSVNGRNTIDVALIEAMQSLDEVVVVGFGVQKKVNVTGAISALDDKDFGRRQVGQSSMLLQGIAPGVTVTQRSGQPGRDGGSVRIRGIGTIGDANPMVLVDGVEMSMNNIDPGTIESISVLKDAASSAIYGSRAANGVILITTKRAKKNQSSINYSAYYGWDNPTDLPEKVNALDHMIYHDIAYVNSGRDPIFETRIQQYLQDGGQDRDNFPDTDWMDLLLKQGKRQNHLLSFNKGYEKLSLAASFGYYKQDGIVNNSSFERLSFRLNSDVEITSKLSAKFDIMLIHNDRPEPISENVDVGEVFFQMYRIPSNQPAIFSNGQYGEGWSGVNPLQWTQDGGIERLRSPQASMNFQFEYKPLTWLTANFVFSPIYTAGHTKRFARALTTYNPDGTIFGQKPLNALMTESYDQTLNKTIRGTILIEKNFAAHRFKILGGYSQEDFSNEFFSAYREGFQLPQYEVLDAGSQVNKDNRGTASEWALSSIFGRINYDFKDKYLLELTARYDGSSRFAEENRFALFPSVSVGWRVVEEPFMEAFNPLVSDLKLRASWGTLGNQNIGASFYPYVSSVPLTVNYNFGNSIVSGARLLDLANEDLKWEQTEMYNIGLDLELLGKLNIAADYFTKNTTDILLRLNIPASLGLNAPFQNAGKVSNKGWELGVKYFDHVGELNYSVTATFSDVINKIEDLRGISSTALTQNREGFAMNSLYGHRAIGYFQNEADIEASPDQFGIEMFPGDIKYKDLDGNGIVDDDDREIFGNTIPRYTYGFNFNLDYKRFDLGLFLQGVGKVDGYLNSSAIMPFFNGGTIYEYHKDYWTPENPDAEFPRLVFNAANNQKNSSFWMKSAAYLRVKNIQLGYSVSPKVINRLGMTSLRFYVTGENLFSSDKFWQGFDVEAPVGSGNFYPQIRTYSVGLNVNL